MARALILGGSGFVGHAIAARLIHDGQRVSVLNRGTRPVAGAEQLLADRDDPDAMRAALARRAFDWVIDTSALTGQRVQNAATALDDRFASWLHLSSASVYAADGRWPMREDHPLGGEAQRAEYATGKLAAEQAVARFAAAAPRPIAIVRPPYIYGPGNHAREEWLWARMLRGRPILVPNEGATPLQFLYARDLADLAVALLESPRSLGIETFNAAHAATTSIARYVELLAAAIGVRARVVHVPYGRLDVTPRSFFPFRDYPCVLDVARIEARLGWRASVDLAMGLAETLASYDRVELEKAHGDHAAEDAILARLARGA